MSTATARSRGLRLGTLAAGQVVSWGILYYALIVAAPAIAGETGWPITGVMLAFSAGLIVSAGAGVFVGRWLDDRGPRLVMTTGALIATVGLVVVSAAPDLGIFALGWVLCGVAQAAVLYQAAFTVVTRRYGERRRGAMTILTLAGGLASTVFAPIVAALLSVMDWRTTFLLLAIALAGITVPLHWCFLEREWPAVPPVHPDEHVHTVRSVLRTRRFWLLEVSVIAITIALFSVTLAVIPLYLEKGLTYELAAWALGLLGAGQVVGRLLYAVIPHRIPPWVPLAVVAVLAAFLLALMAIVPGPPWLLVAIAIAAGAVRGGQTLVQASAVADRWGTRNYGAINGVFAAPITVTAALAPTIGPVVANAAGGYAVMAGVMAGVAVLAGLVARGS